jgi:putative nucleotidyltransferase with HDIG domain
MYNGGHQGCMEKDIVVLIDEDQTRRAALEAVLAKLGAEVEARPSLAGFPLPEAGGARFAVLVLAISDLRSRLLGRLAEIRQSRPGLPIIAVVPAAVSLDILPFIEHGLIDQTAAPDNAGGLLAAVRSERLKVILAQRVVESMKEIRRLKKERTEELRRALEIEEIYESTLENFMAALDLRDVETYGHSKTVARYSQILAEGIGVHEPKTLDNIRKGALLHDVGKIAIPDAILTKAGPLTDQEWEKVRRHPALGYGLVKDIKLVKEVGNIILCHHERFDGAGYPKGLKGGAIPLEARIFAVADTLDAVTSHRPYRGRRDFGAARSEIIVNAGTQFDPAVVDAFCGVDPTAIERVRFETTRLLPSVEAYRHLATKK